MRVLTSAPRCLLRLQCGAILVAVIFCLSAPSYAADAPKVAEYDLKAVFLLNFARFVEWPATAFADERSPLVIGVLGDDPFDAKLDNAVRGEKAQGRSIIVQRYRRVEDITTCHILFVCRSESERLKEIFSQLKNRKILTVGETRAFTLHGGMISFATETNKTRLRIAVEAANAAQLTISSMMLRSAEIVASRNN